MKISNIKQRIFEIVEIGSKEDKASQIYDLVMFVAIVVSLIPLTTKSTSTVFLVIDYVTVIIFLIDYFLRLITADLKLKQGPVSYVKYPFTLMAIIDILAILPSIIPVNSGLKLFKLFRVGRTLKAFKVLKIFKTFRYSKNIKTIISVFKKQKDSLVVVGWLAIAYIFVSALVIFNVEPDTFDTFFDAIYWSVVSLTTVGYGDIYCVSTIGKLLTMVSAIFGVAIVALPAGIVTAGYLEEIKNADENK